METRYLGRTGLKVSELCLGTMIFGREVDEAASFGIMDRFVAAGGNFVDTSNTYSQGMSETIVGRWLQGQARDQIVLATKGSFSVGEGPNQIGASRKHLLHAVEDSLRRLNTDYIDLYQIHCWDPGTSLEETLSTLNQLVLQGKVRYIGASNFKGYQLQKAVDVSRANGWEVMSSLQPLYNLLERTIEWELVEVCRNEGLGIIPWSPLRGGWLTGRYRRGMEPPQDDSRVGRATLKNLPVSWDNYGNERTWQVIETLVEIAEQLGKTPAAVALNWVKDRPGVTAPIIGARNMAQLEGNLASVGWSLDETSRQCLDEVSAVAAPYPYGFIESTRGDR
ncbi:MAG: aldo/keto reductase [Anaerolineae bacterium]|nr:aldo/keto reductase [Anaerolineae bacterium]